MTQEGWLLLLLDLMKHGHVEFDGTPSMTQESKTKKEPQQGWGAHVVSETQQRGQTSLPTKLNTPVPHLRHPSLSSTTVPANKGQE